MKLRLLAPLATAAALAASVLPATLPAQRARPASGSGALTIPPRVVGTYAYEFPDGDTPTGALVVLWRGQPQWFRGAAGGETRTERGAVESGVGGRTGSRRLLTHEGEWNDIRLSFRFDPATDTALVAGQAVALRGANVILVDRIDGVGGAPVVVGTASIDPVVFRALETPILRGRAAREPLREALEGDARVREFLR